VACTVARALLAEFAGNIARVIEQRRATGADSVLEQAPRPPEQRYWGAHCSMAHVASLAKTIRGMYEQEWRLKRIRRVVAGLRAEGVDTMVALLGDANMYWGAIMAQKYGVRVVHARHEHCACAMADGYARHTGKVGVATVTCGLVSRRSWTALTTAARGSIPLVVFAGDSPTSAAWYVQQLELGPLATATGARYLPVKSVDRMLDTVREAFYTARQERCPVVLGVPMDLQKAPFPWVPSIRHQPISCPRRSVLHLTQRW
jgi:thiamine pyrophosphate-dependent acetolactate synthase large subunit-like protein